MGFALDCCAITNIGNRRTSNEDNFFIGEILTPEEQSTMSRPVGFSGEANNAQVTKRREFDTSANRIFAVSDGMGGHFFGEIASYIAVDSIRKFCDDSREGGKRTNGSSRTNKEKFKYIQSFQKLITKTNNKILDYACANGAIDNMGATLTGIIAFPDEVCAFNIGDSSVFLFENGALKKLTADDNETALFSLNKTADGDEAGMLKLKGNGKRLTKYFGLSKSNGVLTATVETPVALQAGQIYVLCSDGLTDSLHKTEMETIIARHIDETAGAGELAQALIGEALNPEHNCRDNITVVTIKVSI